MKVYAHRCRGYGYPEHSVRAIRAALESGVDGIEIDIRLTKDLKWVVIHNPFTQSEELSVRQVHERVYSQLKRNVLALDDVCALVSAYDAVELLVDVKDVGEERQLKKILERHNLLERTIIIAWEPQVLKNVHAIAPSLRLGLSYVPVHNQLRKVKVAIHKPLGRHGVLLRFNELHSFDVRLSIGKTHQHYLSELPELPLHSIQVFALFCSQKTVQLAHERGLKVIAFTVNNRLTASVLRSRGVDGILSNDPLLFIQS